MKDEGSGRRGGRGGRGGRGERVGEREGTGRREEERSAFGGREHRVKVREDSSVVFGSRSEGWDGRGGYFQTQVENRGGVEWEREEEEGGGGNRIPASIGEHDLVRGRRGRGGGRGRDRRERDGNEGRGSGEDEGGGRSCVLFGSRSREREDVGRVGRGWEQRGGRVWGREVSQACQSHSSRVLNATTTSG